MTDTDKTTSDAALEGLFEAARAAPPKLPEAAMARILADAAALQPARRRVAWRDWLRALGGAPGVGGLITAGCVGVWIGVAPPEALPDLGGLVLGQDIGVPSLDADGFGWDIEEG